MIPSRLIVPLTAFAIIASTGNASAGGAMSSGLGHAGSLLEKPTCAKGDPVVWLDTKIMVYFPETSPYYAHTLNGVWACQSDAISKGARLTKYVTGPSPVSPAPSASPSP